MRKSGRGELDANYTNRHIIDAAAGLPRGFPHGALVASLTLGFWVHLTDRSREAAIWRTCLYRAWPKGTRRKELQRSLNGILHVRNRAAHAERLFDPAKAELSPLSAVSDAMRLLRDLCPEAAERLYGDGGENARRAVLRGAPRAGGREAVRDRDARAPADALSFAFVTHGENPL